MLGNEGGGLLAAFVVFYKASITRKASINSISRKPSTTRKNRMARKPSKSSITRNLAQLEILVELDKRTGLIRQMLVGW